MGTIIGNWAGGHNYLTAVKDTFTRSGTSLGSTDTGTPWIHMYGGIGLNSNHAVPLLDSGVTGYRHNQLALLDPYMHYGTFKATVHLDHTHNARSDKNIRLVFWYTDDDNQAFLEIGGRLGSYYYNGWTLNFVVAGTIYKSTVSEIQSLFSYAIGQADISIEIQPEGIKIYQDNVYIVEWNSSAYTSAPLYNGYIGTTFAIPSEAAALTGRSMGIGFSNTGGLSGDTYLGDRWVDNLELMR